MNSHLKISAVIAALALLVPAGASAKRPDDKPAKANKHGKAHKQGKPKTLKIKLVTANVKGMVEANDGTNMTVHVVKASGQAKACKGSSLTFDVSGARFNTADNSGDGEINADDVLVEHIVKVRAKVAISKGHKTACSPGEALVAKAVHNRTTPKVDDDELEEDELLEDEDEFSDEDEFLDDEDFFDDEDESSDDDEQLEDDELVEDDEFLDDEELDEDF